MSDIKSLPRGLNKVSTVRRSFLSPPTALDRIEVHIVGPHSYFCFRVRGRKGSEVESWYEALEFLKDSYSIAWGSPHTPSIASNNSQMHCGKTSDIEDGTGRDKPHDNSGDPDYDDDSGPLFSMYSKMAAEEDRWMAERWQKDADGILVFTGLFSAAISGLLAITIPSLIAISPPAESVAVNLFLFFSLFISLSCAVLATMVQQWARHYIVYTQPSQRGPKTRARIRAMFSHSVDRLFIKCTSNLMPCYLNLAIFFSLIGILILVWNLNHVIFAFTLLLFLWSLGVYGFFTFLPAFQHDSLLYTPLSTFPVSMWTLLVCLINMVSHRRFNYSGWGFLDWAFDDVGQKADAIAKRRSPDIDIHVLDWSLRSLSDDDAVEQYLRAIPDFFRGPSAPRGPLPNTPNNSTRDKFKQALYGFLDRTLSSNTVTDEVRNSRLIVGLDASHVALGPDETLRILEDIYKGKWPKLRESLQTGNLLTSWGNNSDVSYQQSIRSIMIVPQSISDTSPSPPAHPSSTPLSTPPSDTTAVSARQQGFLVFGASSN